MAAHSTETLRRLVQPGKVHRSLYTDPAIFALEMERIFGRTWLYVGHESQVSSPGDFIATRLGPKPVVMSRHTDGRIYVIANQCAHRGAQVVAAESGNCREFRCCYHGWSYHTDGRLKQVPLIHGYPKSFDPRNADAAMMQVPRLASYRGFVFASLAADGPSLEDFLGPITKSFDDLVDRAPDGEIEVAGGSFKHVYRGNWKLYLDNLLDVAHPLFVHHSSTEAAKAQDDSVASDGTGEIAVRQMRQNGASYGFFESQVGIWACRNGHGFMGDYHDDAKLVASMNDPVFRDYRAMLEGRKGASEAKRILAVRRWNTNIYPNVSFMSQFQQFRVVHPLAVDRTVVYTYQFRLKGAPEQMFRNAVAFANVVNGTGSLVLTDDLETYDRIGLGLASEGSEWVDLSRGLDSDVAEPDGSLRGKNSTSEVCLRNMYAAWLGYMAETPRLAAAAE
jgi:phenylpropionate dioxygenase-like ring-hydroxylating dioxygenase large terminal subunit